MPSYSWHSSYVSGALPGIRSRRQRPPETIFPTTENSRYRHRFTSQQPVSCPPGSTVSRRHETKFSANIPTSDQAWFATKDQYGTLPNPVLFSVLILFSHRPRCLASRNDALNRGLLGKNAVTLSRRYRTRSLSPRDATAQPANRSRFPPGSHSDQSLCARRSPTRNHATYLQ